VNQFGAVAVAASQPRVAPVQIKARPGVIECGLAPGPADERKVPAGVIGMAVSALCIVALHGGVVKTALLVDTLLHVGVT
jgi:hypothetical protein